MKKTMLAAMVAALVCVAVVLGIYPAERTVWCVEMVWAVGLWAVLLLTRRKFRFSTPAYLCYGMHEMLNVVTGPECRPEAVLVRGIEGAEGPGRLTKLLKIDRSLNREDLVHSNRLWLESDGLHVKFTAILGKRLFSTCGYREWCRHHVCRAAHMDACRLGRQVFPMMDIF